MKFNIVLCSLIVAFFGNMIFVEKYTEIQTSICNIFFKGDIHSEDVKKLTDEGHEYFETQFYFAPANKVAKIGKQFADFALIEIGFCSILLTLFLLPFTSNGFKCSFVSESVFM